MENTMETTEFTINRSLCEIKFIDTHMKNIDIDIFEYIWFKIRENYNHPIDNFTIKFTELSKNIGKYKNQNKSLIKSIERMKKITIKTNMKSTENQKKFTFKFSVFKIKDKQKGFKVEFDEKIYKLFDKPESYNSYYQNYIYNLNTKHSKLLYKFIIGYKLLSQKSFYVKSDVLMDIMNIESDKGLSYIKSYFIDKSIVDINKKTDLKISIEKIGYEFKNEVEIVKYRIIIDEYKRNNMKVNLTKRTKGKLEFEIRIDDWLKDMKSDLDITDVDGIPIFVIYNDISPLPIYIDNEYKLTNSLDYFTDTAETTLKMLNEWVKSGKFNYGTDTIINYDKKFKKVCLLSKSELKRKRLL
jgi:hypothetical protein